MLNKISLGISLCLFFTAPIKADDSLIGDLSARIDTIEKRIQGENPAGEEYITKENLSEIVKKLTGQIEELEYKLKKMEKEKGDVQSACSVVKDKSTIDSLNPKSAITEEIDEAGIDNGEVEDVLKELGKPTLKEKSEAKSDETKEKATKQVEKENVSVLDSDGSAAQFNQAKGLLNKKEYPAAEEAFKNFLESYPSGKESHAARIHLGDIQLKKKEFKEAKATFAKAYQTNRKGENGGPVLCV